MLGSDVAAQHHALPHPALGFRQVHVAGRRMFQGLESVNPHVGHLLEKIHAVAVAMRAQLSAVAVNHVVHHLVVRENELIEQGMPHPWRQQHLVGAGAEIRSDAVRHHRFQPGGELVIRRRQEPVHGLPFFVKPSIHGFHGGPAHQAAQRMRQRDDGQVTPVVGPDACLPLGLVP